MRKWHRCSRWTLRNIPCPYMGLEDEEQDEDDVPVDAAKPERTTSAKAKATATATAMGSLHAQIEEPISQVEREQAAVSKKRIAVKTPASPPFIGAGAVPMWEEPQVKALQKAWTTPVRESKQANLVYARPGGPLGRSPFPIMAVRVVPQKAKSDTRTATGDIIPVEQATPAQRIAVRPNPYPLMEEAVARAERGQLTSVPKVIAVSEKAPATIAQESWIVQRDIAAIAMAVATASLFMSHGTYVAKEMEKVITRSITQVTTAKPPAVSRGAGTTGARAGGRMKGGAFQTRTIWEPDLKGAGHAPIYRQWETAFSGLLG